MPEVSIIIPIYNTIDYLEDCVFSAVNQTFTDIEIILVDDGSTDGCDLLCNKLAKNDNRIIVIHKKNGGLSDARNAGLDIAKGRFIYFLDSDDTIENNLLETAIERIDDSDLICFSYKQINEDGTSATVWHQLECVYTIKTPEEKLNFLLNILLKYKIAWESWNRLYKKEIIDKYQIRYEDNKKIFAEDLYFCAAYCAHVKKVISIDVVLYNYLVRKDSIMGNNKRNLNFGRMLELSKALLRYYQQFEDCKILCDYYHLLTYMIIDNSLKKAEMYLENTSVKELRKMILADNIDYGFFKEQVINLKQNKKDMLMVFSQKEAARRLAFILYILNGNAVSRKCRNFINRLRKNNVKNGADSISAINTRL